MAAMRPTTSPLRRATNVPTSPMSLEGMIFPADEAFEFAAQGRDPHGVVAIKLPGELHDTPGDRATCERA